MFQIVKLIVLAALFAIISKASHSELDWYSNESNSRDDIQLSQAFSPEGLTFAFNNSDIINNLEVDDRTRVSINKVIDQDKRVRVEQSSQWPYRAIGQVYIKWASINSSSSCSGTLIGKHHVLTAAHCVYNHDIEDDYKWLDPSKSYFTPGINNCNQAAFNEDDCNTMKEDNSASAVPFNQIKIKTARIPSSYKYFPRTKNDYAVLILEEDIGNITGWFGYAELVLDSYVDKQVRITGYPGDKQGWSTSAMWNSHDIINDIDENVIWHQVDTMPGSSGSSVWTWLTVNGRSAPIVLGIHSAGDKDLPQNYAARINKDIFAMLDYWLEKY